MTKTGRVIKGIGDRGGFSTGQLFALCLEDDLPISILGLGTSLLAVLLDESKHVKTNPTK